MFCPQVLLIVSQSGQIGNSTIFLFDNPRLLDYSPLTMNQLGLFDQPTHPGDEPPGPSTTSLPFTVSQLTGYIRRLFEDDATLRDVWVEGEVSSFSRASSGHCYFTLKDAGAEIRCVMWRTVASAQRRLPEHGEQVLAHGGVGVYEARGTYQLYVDLIRPAGIGDLHRQFELLKARLETEGLFDPARKRPLPPWPRRVGVVTSPTAAALRDVLNVLGRRYPLVEVLLSPTLVQGAEAPPRIAAAIQALSERDDVDLVIVARGGGSLEDLWAFNDEQVARAIAACRHPVISGVGHETDFTIADLSADVRASTPSAAAELAVPDRAELGAAVAGLAARLADAMRGQIEEGRVALEGHMRALRHLSPQARLRSARQQVDDLTVTATARVRHGLALRRERLVGLLARLESLSPLATLARGYAIVRQTETKEVVNSVSQVSPGDRLSVRVTDGAFEAKVE
jgi:exodeoxyribonuclease VII large subunit